MDKMSIAMPTRRRAPSLRTLGCARWRWGRDVKLPTITKATWRKAAVIAGVLALALALIRFVSAYQSFQGELVAMNGVRLGASRDEVLYRLGPPPSVLGPVEPLIFDGKVVGHSSRVFFVDGSKADQNTMPAGRSVRDYPGWVYSPDTLGTDLDVEFGKGGHVETLTCTAHGDNPFACSPVAGMRNTDSEEKVLHLGTPSTNSLDGVAKKIEYADIGVRFYLAMGKAYSFSIKRPSGGQGAVLHRFLQTHLP
jgi:hypothetical protein